MKTDLLSLKGGCHKLEIFCRSIFEDSREVFIVCTDDNSTTIDMDGEWIDEIESGCYMPTIDEIDQIIDKLQEAKIYLKGA